MWLNKFSSLLEAFRPGSFCFSKFAKLCNKHIIGLSTPLKTQQEKLRSRLIVYL